MNKNFIILLGLILMTSLIKAASIQIDSNPIEAKIFVSPDGKREIELGKTPYKQDLDDLIDNHVKKMSFILVIRKEGHEPYRIFMTKTGKVDIKLNANLEISRSIQNYKKQDKLIAELFDAQRLIRGRSFNEAISKLTKLEKDYSNMSIVYELKATTYYLMKNIENALAYYRKAFSINSENTDAYKMKEYLEKSLNLSAE
ncbi:hypothetical protein N9N67_04090 [Bacteriovoracaceae bacterium]|nr:hypothetical protein [Bacteriovoracaceae bacterium]